MSAWEGSAGCLWCRLKPFSHFLLKRRSRLIRLCYPGGVFILWSATVSAWRCQDLLLTPQWLRNFLICHLVARILVFAFPSGFSPPWSVFCFQFLALVLFSLNFSPSLLGALGGWGRQVNLYHSPLPYERAKLRNRIFLFSTAVAMRCIIQLHDELANLKPGNLKVPSVFFEHNSFEHN